LYLVVLSQRPFLSLAVWVQYKQLYIVLSFSQLFLSVVHCQRSSAVSVLSNYLLTLLRTLFFFLFDRWISAFSMIISRPDFLVAVLMFLAKFFSVVRISATYLISLEVQTNLLVYFFLFRNISKNFLGFSLRKPSTHGLCLFLYLRENFYSTHVVSRPLASTVLVLIQTLFF